jgi:hypothetical protein
MTSDFPLVGMVKERNDRPRPSGTPRFAAIIYFADTPVLDSGQDFAPVCLDLFRENPSRLLSLWLMVDIHARRFITLLDDLGRLNLQFAKGTAFDSPEITGSVLSAVRQDCELLELRSASKLVNKIRGVVVAGKANPGWHEWAAMIQELRTRIEEDLEESVFFQVAQENVRRCFRRTEKNGFIEFALKPPEDFMGQDVAKRFVSTAKDTEEALKCFSRGCNTACVFHLARVLEVGLRALGKSLNNPALDPERNPSWESILKKCDDELVKPHSQRAPEWQVDSQFFAEVSANLRAVKDAWRNPTMHVDVDYDEERRGMF